MFEATVCSNGVLLPGNNTFGAQVTVSSISSGVASYVAALVTVPRVHLPDVWDEKTTPLTFRSVGQEVVCSVKPFRREIVNRSARAMFRFAWRNVMSVEENAFI